MKRIVGASLSQFNDNPNEFEFLISYEDGREIGHTLSRPVAHRIAREMAEQSGLDDENSKLREALQFAGPQLEILHRHYSGKDAEAIYKVIGLVKAAIASTQS